MCSQLTFTLKTIPQEVKCYTQKIKGVICFMKKLRGGFMHFL